MRSLDNLGGPRFRRGRLTLKWRFVCGIWRFCSLLMVVLLSLWLFGSRSFVAIANYQDLDAKSRHALDIMSLEIRQATQVLGFQSSGSDRWLVLTNEAKNLGLKYNWDAASRTLTGQKTGRSPEVYLTECDAWQFELYQRTPPSEHHQPVLSRDKRFWQLRSGYSETDRYVLEMLPAQFSAKK